MIFRFCSASLSRSLPDWLASTPRKVSSLPGMSQVLPRGPLSSLSPEILYLPTACQGFQGSGLKGQPSKSRWMGPSLCPREMLVREAMSA